MKKFFREVLDAGAKAEREKVLEKLDKMTIISFGKEAEGGAKGAYNQALQDIKQFLTKEE